MVKNGKKATKISRKYWKGRTAVLIVNLSKLFAHEVIKRGFAGIIAGDMVEMNKIRSKIYTIESNIFKDISKVRNE